MDQDESQRGAPTSTNTEHRRRASAPMRAKPKQAARPSRVKVRCWCPSSEPPLFRRTKRGAVNSVPVSAIRPSGDGQLHARGHETSAEACAFDLILRDGDDLCAATNASRNQYYGLDVLTMMPPEFCRLGRPHYGDRPFSPNGVAHFKEPGLNSRVL
jgi:hypothetical protein